MVCLIGVSLLKRPVSSFSIKDKNTQIEQAKTYGDSVVGWLEIEGTNIDLPLIRATSTTDLLSTTYDFAWTNSNPDAKSNRPAFISHNILNVSSNPLITNEAHRRFEQLMSFIYPSFIKKHQFIAYTNEQGKTYLYRIYGVSLVKDNQEAAFLDTYTLKEQEAYIQKVAKESMYQIKTDVAKEDKLLTLFTCTRFYGVDTSYSFRVDARRLRDNEEKTYAVVKTNKNYQKIKKRMKEGETNEKI